jgi:hypothetical protein
MLGATHEKRNERMLWAAGTAAVSLKALRRVLE